MTLSFRESSAIVLSEDSDDVSFMASAFAFFWGASSGSDVERAIGDDCTLAMPQESEESLFSESREGTTSWLGPSGISVSNTSCFDIL